MPVTLQTVGIVGEPVEVAGEVASSSPPKSDFAEGSDQGTIEKLQECVCLQGNFRCSLRPPLFCCCCLCQVHCNRIPLIMFHVLLGVVAISHYAPIVRFLFGLQTMLGGLCFFLAVFVYAPLTACCALHQRWLPSSSKCGDLSAYLGRRNRFTVISHCVVSLFALLIILPVLLVSPLASDLNDGALEKEFGAGNPPSPSEVSLDFGQWLFQGLSTNGPYESKAKMWTNEPIEPAEMRQEFIYKAGLPTSPPQDDCYRAWAPHLMLDVHFPEACMQTNSCTNEVPLAPIIFHTHCGGWEVGDKSEVCGGWSNMAYFLERGYAIVSPQYRLACHGYNAMDMLADLRDAYHFVRSNATTWHLDMNSIHLMGGSAGGHLALLMGYAGPGNAGNFSGIKSITSLYGMTDFSSLDTDVCTNDDTLLTVTSGCDAEGMRLASPVNYITVDSPPTLIFHGTLDTLIPYGQAVILKEKLDAVGVPNYLMTMYSWDHVLERGYYGVPAQMFRYAFERILAARK